jgi:hypothetical protein
MSAPVTIVIDEGASVTFWANFDAPVTVDISMAMSCSRERSAISGFAVTAPCTGLHGTSDAMRDKENMKTKAFEKKPIFCLAKPSTINVLHAIQLFVFLSASLHLEISTSVFLIVWRFENSRLRQCRCTLYQSMKALPEAAILNCF